MSQLYGYNYAEIDPATGMCIGILSTSAPQTESESLVAIPVNDGDYLLKYYINGAWYEDAEGTIPWESSML